MGTSQWNIADIFETVVDLVPHRVALVCGARRFAYAEHDARATRLANTLLDASHEPFEHVALYLSNGPEYLEAMTAAFKARLVPVNVNYRYVETELRYLLDNCDATAVVVHSRFAATLAAIRDTLPQLRTVLQVDDGSGAPLLRRAVRYEAALVAADGERRDPGRTPDDHYILYTGGTTGMPKGVVWRQVDIYRGAFATYGGSPATFAAHADVVRADPQVVCPTSPLMHGAAHWVSYGALLHGGTVVLLPEPSFHPADLLDAIERERVTFVQIVGDAFARPLLDELARSPERDLTSLQVVLSGGAILSPSVKEALLEALPHITLMDGFGTSETGGQGSATHTRGGAVGRAPRFRMSSTTCVLDPVTGRVAEPGDGTIGRIARRGNVPLEYYKDPEKTTATFPTFAGVRYALAGDDAYVEPDGTIVMLGRGSQCINSGGEKIYPEEVEAVLKSHPGVFDAVVVGVPSARWGEEVTAVVRTRDGHAVEPADIASHTRAYIAGYKVPKRFVFVDMLVRSPSGKADYRWAKAAAMAALDEADPVAKPG